MINKIEQIIIDGKAKLGLGDSSLWREVYQEISHIKEPILDSFCNCDMCVEDFVDVCYQHYKFDPKEAIRLKKKYSERYRKKV